MMKTRLTAGFFVMRIIDDRVAFFIAANFVQATQPDVGVALWR